MTDDDEPRTKYFALSEWEQNVGNPKWPEAEAYPREWVESRWRPLAELLDVIRAAWGSPIYLTPSGGYRAPAHNRRVDGTARSQHMEGRAADIRPASGSARKLHAFVLQLHKDGRLPGLGGLGYYGEKFVHVDTRPRTARQRLAQWGEPDTRDQIA
jgi:hypothetical protein